MPLVPIPVRNNTPEEAARFAADMEDRKNNPGNWGINSKPKSGSPMPKNLGRDFEYLSEKELEKFQKSALDWYARAMPNGFDPDEKEMTAKEILAAIMEKTPSN